MFSLGNATHRKAHKTFIIQPDELAGSQSLCEDQHQPIPDTACVLQGWVTPSFFPRRQLTDISQVHGFSLWSDCILLSGIDLIYHHLLGQPPARSGSQH